MIKLNLGCGPDLRKGYVNIDIDNIEDIKEKYKIKNIEDFDFKNYSVLDLPYEDESVDEIMCNGFLEHLSFVEERIFFKEADRVLKSGATLKFTVPDFDSLVNQWQKAKDNFIEFYTTDKEEHWFGNNSRRLDNKWGYLTASIFGHQNGKGQFHRNAYTIKKICKILNSINFTYSLDFFYFKETEIEMIKCEAVKK